MFPQTMSLSYNMALKGLPYMFKVFLVVTSSNQENVRTLRWYSLSYNARENLIKLKCPVNSLCLLDPFVNPCYMLGENKTNLHSTL